MKLSTVILAGSLAANAVVLGLIFLANPVAPSFADKTGQALTSASAGTKSNPRSGMIKAKTWAQLETPDMPAFIARLRTAGFPDVVIRAMVSERLRLQFAERRKAVLGEAAAYEFWKPGGIYNSGYMADPKTRAALRDLSQEQSKLLKDLLGPDPGLDDFSGGYRRRQYGNLSREKIDQVSLVTQDYADLMTQVRNSANGVMLQEDREKLVYLDAEKHKDLAAILTPEELADYEMRTSTTTSRLRFQLSSVELTEQQFMAIYRIQQPFDDKYNVANGGFTSAEQAQARRDAQKQVAADIRAALGEPTATEYDHAMDQGYQTASRVVTRLALPQTAIQQVVDVQKDIEARALTVRTDRSLSPDQRNAQLSALSKEATEKLTATLGTKGLNAYKDNGGYWLPNLTPPQQRP